MKNLVNTSCQVSNKSVIPSNTVSGSTIIIGNNANAKVLTEGKPTYFGGVDLVILGCSGTIGSDTFMQSGILNVTISPTATKVSAGGQKASLDGDTAYEWVSGIATSPSGATYPTSVYMEIKVSNAGQSKVKGQ